MDTTVSDRNKKDERKIGNWSSEETHQLNASSVLAMRAMKASPSRTWVEENIFVRVYKKVPSSFLYDSSFTVLGGGKTNRRRRTPPLTHAPPPSQCLPSSWPYMSAKIRNDPAGVPRKHKANILIRKPLPSPPFPQPMYKVLGLY